MIFKAAKLLARCGAQTICGNFFDYLLRIRTSENDRRLSYENLDQYSRYKDSVSYQPAGYLNIQRIIRILEPNENDIFYDLGCGMGRVVCVFARLHIRCSVGIDINSFLCDVARTNAARLRKRRSPIEIRCEDAVFSSLADGTIYFFYNPFGKNTFSAVLKKIEDSLIANPRFVRIVYYNTVFEKIFLDSHWLSKFAELRTLTDKRITFWKSHPGRMLPK